jgi:hypothetical protein
MFWLAGLCEICLQISDSSPKPQSLDRIVVQQLSGDCNARRVQEFADIASRIAGLTATPVPRKARDRRTHLRYQRCGRGSERNRSRSRAVISA